MTVIKKTEDQSTAEDVGERMFISWYLSAAIMANRELPQDSNLPSGLFIYRYEVIIKRDVCFPEILKVSGTMAKMWSSLPVHRQMKG